MNVNQYMACISHDSEDGKKNTVSKELDGITRTDLSAVYI